MNAVTESLATAEPVSVTVPTIDGGGVQALDSEGRPRKQADVLTDIGRAHVLFRDTDGSAYARVEVGDHHEVHRIDSGAYREVLAGAFLGLVGKGCNRNALGDAVTTLSAIARFNGETAAVWLRTAEVNDGIVIDMGTPDWRCIEITAAGWRPCANAPMFRRSGAPLPLPEPKEPDFARLWKYINIVEEHRPLLAAFLLAALRPHGPYPQLHLSGEHGSGKSTVARMVKALVDPSASPLRAPPKDQRDLLVGALNGWCLSLDNLSFLTPQLSDALCRLATGGAISERALYTNSEEVLIEVERPVVLNGIEDLATRPDLADRGLHIECETIDHRQSERELWAAFNADKGHIFGALLQGLVLALRDHRSVEVGRLPRMADFATWAAAGIPALGFTAEEFMAAYRETIATGQTAAIESSPVGRAIVKFMDTREEWSGTASDLYAELAVIVDEATLKSHSWPRSPRGLSGMLRRLAPALRFAGISVTTERQPDRSRTRAIRLCNRGKRPSEPSRTSEAAPPLAALSDDADGVDGINLELHSAICSAVPDVPDKSWDTEVEL